MYINKPVWFSCECTDLIVPPLRRTSIHSNYARILDVMMLSRRHVGFVSIIHGAGWWGKETTWDRCPGGIVCITSCEDCSEYGMVSWAVSQLVGRVSRPVDPTTSPWNARSWRPRRELMTASTELIYNFGMTRPIPRQMRLSGNATEQIVDATVATLVSRPVLMVYIMVTSIKELDVFRRLLYWPKYHNTDNVIMISQMDAVPQYTGRSQPKRENRS